jgi:hypothetical protein
VHLLVLRDTSKGKEEFIPVEEVGDVARASRERRLGRGLDVLCGRGPGRTVCTTTSPLVAREFASVQAVSYLVVVAVVCGSTLGWMVVMSLVRADGKMPNM